MPPFPRWSPRRLADLIKDWRWRRPDRVVRELDLPPEYPPDVMELGGFMREQSERAASGDLSPRDVAKANLIARFSMQREARPSEALRQRGLEIPAEEKTVRPEGAMARWLGSSAGQKYLDAAERERVREPSVQDAQRVLRPFGMTGSSLRDIMETTPRIAKPVTPLVRSAVTEAATGDPWMAEGMMRDVLRSVPGVAATKRGFWGSLLGYGLDPTLDARQVTLHSGAPYTEAKPFLQRSGGMGAEAAVDRLRQRQAEMRMMGPSWAEPFRQALTHQTVWNKSGPSAGSHSDIIEAMRRFGAGALGVGGMAAAAPAPEEAEGRRLPWGLSDPPPSAPVRRQRWGDLLGQEEEEEKAPPPAPKLSGVQPDAASVALPPQPGRSGLRQFLEGIAGRKPAALAGQLPEVRVEAAQSALPEVKVEAEAPEATSGNPVLRWLNRKRVAEQAEVEGMTPDEAGEIDLQARMSNLKRNPPGKAATLADVSMSQLPAAAAYAVPVFGAGVRQAAAEAAEGATQEALTKYAIGQPREPGRLFQAETMLAAALPYLAAEGATTLAGGAALARGLGHMGQVGSAIQRGLAAMGRGGEFRQLMARSMPINTVDVAKAAVTGDEFGASLTGLVTGDESWAKTGRTGAIAEAVGLNMAFPGAGMAMRSARGILGQGLRPVTRALGRAAEEVQWQAGRPGLEPVRRALRGTSAAAKAAAATALAGDVVTGAHGLEAIGEALAGEEEGGRLEGAGAGMLAAGTLGYFGKGAGRGRPAAFKAWSRMERAIARSKEARRPAKHWLDIIRQQAPETERMATGMEDWLRGHEGTVLTRDEVLAEAMDRRVPMGRVESAEPRAGERLEVVSGTARRADIGAGNAAASLSLEPDEDLVEHLGRRLEGGTITDIPLGGWRTRSGPRRPDVDANAADARSWRSLNHPDVQEALAPYMGRPLDAAEARKVAAIVRDLQDAPDPLDPGRYTASERKVVIPVVRGDETVELVGARRRTGGRYRQWQVALDGRPGTDYKESLLVWNGDSFEEQHFLSGEGMRKMGSYSGPTRGVVAHIQTEVVPAFDGKGRALRVGAVQDWRHEPFKAADKAQRARLEKLQLGLADARDKRAGAAKPLRDAGTDESEWVRFTDPNQWDGGDSETLSRWVARFGREKAEELADQAFDWNYYNDSVGALERQIAEWPSREGLPRRQAVQTPGEELSSDAFDRHGTDLPDEEVMTGPFRVRNRAMGWPEGDETAAITAMLKIIVDRAMELGVDKIELPSGLATYFATTNPGYLRRAFAGGGAWRREGIEALDWLAGRRDAPTGIHDSNATTGHRRFYEETVPNALRKLLNNTGAPVSLRQEPRVTQQAWQAISTPASRQASGSTATDSEWVEWMQRQRRAIDTQKDAINKNVAGWTLDLTPEFREWYRGTIAEGEGWPAFAAGVSPAAVAPAAAGAADAAGAAGEEDPEKRAERQARATAMMLGGAALLTRPAWVAKLGRVFSRPPGTTAHPQPSQVPVPSYESDLRRLSAGRGAVMGPVEMMNPPHPNMTVQEYRKWRSRQGINWARQAASIVMEADVDVLVKRQAAEAVLEKGLKHKVPQTFKEFTAYARELGLDPEELLQAARERGWDAAQAFAGLELSAQNARNILAREKDIHALGQHLATLRAAPVLDEKAIKAAEEEIADLQAYQNALHHQSTDLLGAYQVARSQAGRNLNWFKQLANTTMEPVVWYGRAKAMLDSDRPFTVEMKAEIDRLIKSEDRVKLAQYVAGLQRRGPLDWGITLFKSGLLQNPSTHIANMTSNTAMMFMESMKDAPAAVADRLVASMLARLGATGGRRTRDFSPAADAAALAAGMRRGWSAARRIVQGGVPLDQAARMRWHELARELKADTSSPTLNKLIDWYTNGPFRLLSAEDQLFRQAAVERSIRQQMRLHRVSAPTEDMWAVAHADGLVATFQNPSVIGAAGGAVKQMLAKHGGGAGRAAGEVLMPFTRTPGAVVGAAWDYSPSGLVVNVIKDTFRLIRATKKDAGAAELEALQRTLVDGVGRGMTGTALAALGVLAYNAGIVKVKPPREDRAGRDMGEVLGDPGNTVDFGPLNMQVERISPVANAMLWGAYFAQATKAEQMVYRRKELEEKQKGSEALTPEEADELEGLREAISDATMLGTELTAGRMGEAFVQGTASVGTVVAEQPVFTGPQRIAEIMRGTGDPLKTGQSMAGSIAKRWLASTVPGGVATAARTLDPTVREPETLGEHFRARIPGLSRGVPAKLNALGQPTNRTMGERLGNLVAPGRLSASRDLGESLEARINQAIKAAGVELQRPNREVGAGETMPEYRERSGIAGGYLREEMEQLLPELEAGGLSLEERKSLIRQAVANARKRAREEMRGRREERQ